MFCFKIEEYSSKILTSKYESVKSNIRVQKNIDISYLNLNFYNKFQQENQTPYTFPTFLLSAYNIAVCNILNNNIILIEQNLYKHRNYLINEMKKINYFTKIKTNISNWVINFECKNPKDLYDFLYKHNILCYRCKDKLIDNCIQICIMNINKDEIDYLIDCIKLFNTN